ncbi:bifunctional folylpolyglutamate synthase/dihydrofolate synthase [Desulfovibrio mangrovi]|uniref:bifunctional folylpolyglutamate synthase/dihydrofolate synthase n=1 Tax=Desulfovibrio mangrovi TaxID=2976983 RepID=UPI0022451B32|nr:cyanophycin synthetase [Desulfovibrio mangrovi]UZP69102.1 bifunctional folylpolyglutamate synthase/dihydrofolate synthase [Desulfovibrio mangrovi]
MSETERNHFPTYDAFEAYLDKLGLFHMDLSLDRITKVLDELELRRPPYAVAHVLGTNGKGSTAAFLTSLAQSTGLNSGLYTSPHFTTPRERVRINGHMLDEEEWCDLANDIMDAGGDTLTYFEFLTVLAVLAFYDYEVDIAVMEAGLGGLYDATNALETDITVYAPIAYDHQHVLGNRLEDIARDKAGAIRKGVPVVTNVQEDAALAVLSDVAAQQGTTLHMAAELITMPENPRIGLMGPHQKDNACLALGAFKLLVDKYGWAPPPIMDWDDVKELGFADAWIAGRMQEVEAQADHPALILDGAHNGHAFAALKESLKVLDIHPAAVIFGCMKDKPLDDIIPQLLALSEGPVFLPPIADNERAMEPEALAEIIGERARICVSLGEALRLSKKVAQDKVVLLCGSLYLLGEFFTLRPKCLERD